MQEEVSKWFLHSLISRYILLTLQGCPTSLNYMFSFAENKDRSEAKCIKPYSKDEDQEDAASYDGVHVGQRASRDPVYDVCLEVQGEAWRDLPARDQGL
jgi:hypothetical protein